MGDGDAGETARLASRARQGASDGGTVHRGRLLEVDADTAARGVLERLFGLFGEIVVLETVNGDQSGIDTVRAQACQRGADAKANTILGGGALEVGNHCLLEDGSERGGALVSDAVVPDTTRDVWGHSERAGACQRALTRKRTLRGRRCT